MNFGVFLAVRCSQVLVDFVSNMQFSRLLASIALLGFGLAAQPPCTTAAASPYPAGFHCGDQGTLKTPSALATVTTVDQIHCRNKCLNNKNCLSFSYNTANNQCVLSTQNLVSQGYKKSTNGIYYFNKHCFKITCPKCPSSGQDYCPALQGCTNLQTDSSNCGSCGKAVRKHPCWASIIQC